MLSKPLVGGLFVNSWLMGFMYSDSIYEIFSHLDSWLFSWVWWSGLVWRCLWLAPSNTVGSIVGGQAWWVKEGRQRCIRVSRDDGPPPVWRQQPEDQYLEGGGREGNA